LPTNYRTCSTISFLIGFDALTNVFLLEIYCRFYASLRRIDFKIIGNFIGAVDFGGWKGMRFMSGLLAFLNLMLQSSSRFFALFYYFFTDQF
jgi:hypothetical protein